MVGYPRIFNGEDCNAFTWFSPAEEARLNQTADLLNSRLAAAASGAGFSFANPTSRFVGHAVCDSDEWINGLSNPISESYHPKATGHASGYTPDREPAADRRRRRRHRARSSPPRPRARDEQAALQQQYADADRSIEPEVVLAPDLTTPEARRAARQAGVDIDRFIARSSR